MEKEKKIRVLMALARYRLKDVHLRDLEPNTLKSRIGDAVKKSEFSEFSKEELLEITKEVAIDKFKKMIEDLKKTSF